MGAAVGAAARIAPAAAHAAEPKRVLVIYSFGRDFAPYNVVASTLRTNLTQLMRESVALHETSRDVERGNSPEEEQLFLDYVVRRNRGVPPECGLAARPRQYVKLLAEQKENYGIEESAFDLFFVAFPSRSCERGWSTDS